MSQFSLFGAAVAAPALTDLDGVLLGGGRWVRGGPGARLSVIVADLWRADGLAQEFAARGLAISTPVSGPAGGSPVSGPGSDGSIGSAGSADADAGSDADPGSDAHAGAGEHAIIPAASGWSVRTRFAAELDQAARRWSTGAGERPPPEFELTPGVLRLWTLVAGRCDGSAYLLSTGRASERLHLLAGAGLARLGLTGVSLGARGGPGWRITSAKRVRRLAELVGPPPPAGAADWPHT